MNTHPIPVHLVFSPEARLMQAYDQIDHTIVVAEALIADLKPKRDQLFAELERRTAPAPKAIPLVRGPAYMHAGRLIRTASGIDAYLGLLRALWTELPERRNEMARAMAQHGRSRNYVATERGSLFLNKGEGWTCRFSTSLVEGWWADTNLNDPSKRKLARVAVRAAGLAWKTDVDLHV